jgi:ABC-2 type transport system permease protein
VLFHVPLHGSVLLLTGLTCIFLIGGICQGLLISIMARDSQLIANQIGLISSFLPAFLLSGFIFSISNMPRPLQLVTYIVPARYFITILKGIFMKGSGLNLLWEPTMLLIGYGLLVFIIANKRFHKRID